MANSKFVAALAVVDMQEDFCEPNGALAVKNGRKVAPLINHMLQWSGWAAKIATRDYHPANHISFASQHDGKEAFTSSHTIKNPCNKEEEQTTLLWPNHCVQSTPGAEIIPELHSNLLTHIIDKGMDIRVESYSAFGPPFRKPAVAMSQFDETLKAAGVTHVFVVGLAYDFCVKCTAIDAVEFGYETYVVEDATEAVMQNEVRQVRQELVGAGVKIIRSDDAVLKQIGR